MPNHEYRIQRGRILKMLYHAFPGGLSDRVISLTLNDIRLTATSGILRGHCTYLTGRGLVTVEEVTDPRFDIGYIVALTSEGVDCVEKCLSDDGIDLGV